MWRWYTSRFDEAKLRQNEGCLVKKPSKAVTKDFLYNGRLKFTFYTEMSWVLNYWRNETVGKKSLFEQIDPVWHQDWNCVRLRSRGTQHGRGWAVVKICRLVVRPPSGRWGAPFPEVLFSGEGIFIRPNRARRRSCNWPWSGSGLGDRAYLDLVVYYAPKCALYTVFWTIIFPPTCSERQTQYVLQGHSLDTKSHWPEIDGPKKSKRPARL